MKLSAVVAQEEAKEAKLAKIESDVSVMLSRGSLSRDQEQEVTDLQNKIEGLRKSQVSVREESLKILRDFKDEVRRGEE